MAKLVSKVYGEALFEAVQEVGRLDEVMDEITAVSQALRDNPQLLTFMEHPKIIREEKVGFIEQCFKGRVSEEVTGFLCIVTGKGRFKELPQMLEFLTARIKSDKKIGSVQVTSAVKLNDRLKDKLVKRLVETTGYEELEMEYQMDESLIGGLVIRIGDRVVDSSLKYKLSRLKDQLLKLSLEQGKAGENVT